MSTALRNHPSPRREERHVRPQRFGSDIDGALSPNLLRVQFEHLFRQFGR